MYPPGLLLHSCEQQSSSSAHSSLSRKNKNPSRTTCYDNEQIIAVFSVNIEKKIDSVYKFQIINITVRYSHKPEVMR